MSRNYVCKVDPRMNYNSLCLLAGHFDDCAPPTDDEWDIISGEYQDEPDPVELADLLVDREMPELPKSLIPEAFEHIKTCEPCAKEYIASLRFFISDKFNKDYSEITGIPLKEVRSYRSKESKDRINKEIARVQSLYK